MTQFLLNDQSFQLREMCLEDLSDILAIEQVTHGHPWKESHFISSINSSHQCRIVLQQSKIVAYIITSTAADEAELLNITVAPEFQRQGIAQQLLCMTCELFNSDTHKNIHTLFLEVRESNLPAISLYEGIGFNEVGVRANYYPAEKSASKNSREDAVIMAKSL